MGATRKTWEQLAASQFGLVTRRQGETCDLTRREIEGLIRRRVWIRAHPGVYRVSTASTDWPHALMAAWLWGEGRAIVSHRAAAALWELEGFWKSNVELTSTSGLKAPDNIKLHRTRTLERADRTMKRGIGVTTVERTLLDLSGVVPERALERALHQALREKLVTVEQLRWCIERNGRRGREGIGRLTTLLDEADGLGVTDSVLELEVLDALRRARITSPVRQHEVIEAERFIARVDFAWPKKKVALQAHGGVHRQRRNYENDQRVENLLPGHGWALLKVTHQMLLLHQDEFVANLGRVLAAR
jgi:very-short-patch-repair endonuclease